jgi:hypothetical protein
MGPEGSVPCLHKPTMTMAVHQLLSQGKWSSPHPLTKFLLDLVYIKEIVQNAWVITEHGNITAQRQWIADWIYGSTVFL